ncbi:MAG: carbohydrate kinase family protein [Bacteroidetes bacterium]|nr:carbohydrate kinase family protein [Bacteroidota bacterium]
MKNFVSVIGGINLDVKGISEKENLSADSYIGRIKFSPGGVARNISENLARLNIPVYLFGCAGTDANGQFVIDKTHSAGVNTDHIKAADKIPTSCYLSISDNSGNLVSAVNDMRDSLNLVSPEYIEEKKEILEKSKIIVADTNLQKETLEKVITIGNENNIPVFIDTVSSEKSLSVNEVEGRIDLLSPNENEYKKIFGEFNVDKVALELDMLKYKKFKSIILKRGEKGVVFIDTEKMKVKFFNSIKLEAIEPNGAGDAFNAGFLYGVMNKYDYYDCVELGICASYFALKSENSVPENLTEENLLKLYKRKIQNEF